MRELAPTASDARLAEAIETRSANCAVVGLGHVGTAVATALLDGGFSVHGLDRSPAAVLRFIEAFAERDGSVTAGTDPEALAEADVVHVAVPVECLGRDRPDLEALRSVAHDLRRHRRPARLTVIHSTVPPGTTRWFANELADAPEAGSAFVAHSPERLQPGNAAWTVANIPHAVAGGRRGFDDPGPRAAAANSRGGRAGDGPRSDRAGQAHGERVHRGRRGARR